jgi:ABC-type multidrug transport system fused ATPase/permease subunit
MIGRVYLRLFSIHVLEFQMSPRQRVALLILIMSIVVLTVEAITVTSLYNAAIEEEKSRLIEAAKSQARLIEAIARFDRVFSKDYPKGAREASLQQIRDAHSKYRGFGETGEFTLSKKENNQIFFLLSHRHYDLDEPKPVPWNSELAAPMRQALSGKSGTIIGLDYRGEMVLAAHEPVQELDLGIVAKIDLAEVRAPFIRASLISGSLAIILIALGAALFLGITNPLIQRLHQTVNKLQTALAEVKTLRGILPICSFCKKIRDDEGAWNQVEAYVQKHSEANFSHGICPDCLQVHYPEQYKIIQEQDRSKD